MSKDFGRILKKTFHKRCSALFSIFRISIHIFIIQTKGPGFCLATEDVVALKYSIPDLDTRYSISSR